MINYIKLKLISTFKPTLFFLMLFFISVVTFVDAVTEPAQIAPLASQSLLLDIVNIDDLFFAVGERGHILFSENGRDWVQQNVPTNVFLTAVYFIDRNKGWVVGHDATILRTIDGGQHWEQVFDSPDDEAPLLDIWFKDDMNGLAVGAYGLYLKTQDGGKTWQRSDLEVVKDNKENSSSSESDEFVEFYELHLNKIISTNEGVLYIAAEAGRIYKSDNYGESWIELSSPYSGSFFGIISIDKNVLLVFGLRGNLFRSEDAGNSWIKVETDTREMLTDAISTEDRLIYICGMGGTLLVSTDGGKSFNKKEMKNRNSFTSIAMKDKNVITVGENGVNILANLIQN